MNSAIQVQSLLEREAVRFALIGGSALAARGYARSTYDTDYLVVDARVLTPEFWEPVAAGGMTVHIRRGDFDDPLRGVVRVTAGEAAATDVVVAKYKWQEGVILRSELVHLAGRDYPVPLASDLILLKLFAGGAIDQRDVEALVAANDSRTAEEVDLRVHELPLHCQDLWKQMRGR